MNNPKNDTVAAFNSIIQVPPPTIWNANIVMKEPELLMTKPWPSKLETIKEGSKKNSFGKLNQTKIPLAFPALSGSQFENYRNEPVTVKVPVIKNRNLSNHDFMNNFRNKNIHVFSKEKAAVIIQQAYKKYKKKKRAKKLSQKSYKTTTITSPTSNHTTIVRDNYVAVVSSETYETETSRSLIFKDYLKEGSLFFPERESVVVFGGIDPHSKYGDGRNTGRNIFRYNSELNQWDLVGELPQPRHHHAVAFLKGKVYLAGGTDPRDDEKGKTVVVGTVWSFDPVSRAWYKESDMLTPRKNFGLAVMNGKLLAIGGQDKDGRILSSVEKYDPATGIWEYIAKLNTERTGAAATKYNDTVWVAGGMTSSRKTPLTSTVESYDPKINVWIEQSPLRFPRCFGCLFATNEVLYFIGGAGRASEKERTTSSCNAIDLWNHKEEEWKLHFAMSIPRHGHAVAYLGTQILIIGGVTTAYLRALTDVECFCCERKTWVRGLAGLPVPLSGHGAVTLPPASLM